MPLDEVAVDVNAAMRVMGTVYLGARVIESDNSK